MENTPKLDVMAADIHMLAAPLRVLGQLLLITLMIVSFPALCLGLLLMVGYGAQIHTWMLSLIQQGVVDGVARSWGWWIGLIPVELTYRFIDAPSPDEIGLLHILLAVFGPFASCLWFGGMVRWYQLREEADGGYWHKVAKTSMYVIVGFVLSAIAGGYVALTQGIDVPAVYFSKAIVACFAPSLMYLLYRAFKTKPELTDTF